jgi:hypothetical protein
LAEPAAAEAPLRPEKAPDDAARAGVLPWLKPFALFAIAAVIFGRGVAPSIAGSGVGAGKLIDAVERAGGVVSQSFVILGSVVLLGLVLVVARSAVAPMVRTAALSLGGLVTLLVLSAAPSRSPDATLAAIGVASSALAIVAAWSARRAVLARGAAIAIGAVGLSSLARLAAIGLLAHTHDHAALASGAARVLAATSLGLDGLALLAGASTLAPPRASGKLVSPALVVTLVLGLVLARYVVAGPDEGSFAAILLRRSLQRLVTRPAVPHLDALRAFVTALAPLVALAALASRRLVPAVSAALALALMVRSTPETPLCGLVLAIAALALALGSQGGRTLWAALEAQRAAARPNDA